MTDRTARFGSITIDDAVLRYTVEGTGRPVLVVGSAVYYPRVFSRRLREACTLAYVDVRHFAQSGTVAEPERLSFDTYADDIDRMRAALGFDRVAVVGHSHHGNVALEYAKRYPERVTHVVMIGSPPVGIERTIEASDDYWAAHASKARKGVLRRNRDRFSSREPASMSRQEAFIARYVADGPKYWYDPGYDASPLWNGVDIDMRAVDAFRGLFEDYDLSWDPERLKAPVLVAMGRHDYVVPHVLWDAALPSLENVTYHLFDRSGHTPPLEEAERFDAVFLEWLRANAVDPVSDEPSS